MSLIKIDDRGGELDHLIEELKAHFGKGTAAAAVRELIKVHMITHKKMVMESKRADKFEDLYFDLQSLIKQKAQIEASIRTLAGQ